MTASARGARRAFLGVAAVALCGAVAPVRAHGLLGPVSPPEVLPAVGVTLHDGRRLPLSAVLRGRFTALQLMFTGCSSICPVQGALFAELQADLKRGGAGSAVAPQLLSLSIDALGDDARALAAWRARFGAGSDWLAAVPDAAGADRLLDSLRGRTTGVDRHSAQVFLVDADARLVFRCAELAAVQAVAQVLRQFRR